MLIGLPTCTFLECTVHLWIPDVHSYLNLMNVHSKLILGWRNF